MALCGAFMCQAIARRHVLRLPFQTIPSQFQPVLIRTPNQPQPKTSNFIVAGSNCDSGT